MKKIPKSLYFNLYGRYGQHRGRAHETKKEAEKAAKRNSSLGLFKAAVKYTRES